MEETWEMPLWLMHRVDGLLAKSGRWYEERDSVEPDAQPFYQSVGNRYLGWAEAIHGEWDLEPLPDPCDDDDRGYREERM